MDPHKGEALSIMNNILYLNKSIHPMQYEFLMEANTYRVTMKKMETQETKRQYLDFSSATASGMTTVKFSLWWASVCSLGEKSTHFLGL